MFLQIDEDQIRNDHTTDIFRGSLIFYHYKCDGKNDVGWGCAYRTIQTLSSWIIKTKKDCSTQTVPTIDRIQEILVDLEDKPKSFQQSNQWIGTYEASIVLSQLFDVDCKLIHIANGSDLRQHVETLRKHFHEFGSPVMMGGDADAASKCLLGVKSDREFLILDPHYSGSTLTSVDHLRQSGYLRWYRVPDDFISSSFYNLCLPQLKRL